MIAACGIGEPPALLSIDILKLHTASRAQTIPCLFEPPPSAGTTVANEPLLRPRSTQRYSSLAVQFPLITP